MLEHFRKSRKNRYWAAFVIFSGSPFLKSGIILAIFIFSGQIPFSSDRLNKCFRGSMISPKHFLKTLKFIPPYRHFSF